MGLLARLIVFDLPGFWEFKYPMFSYQAIRDWPLFCIKPDPLYIETLDGMGCDNKVPEANK